MLGLNINIDAIKFFEKIIKYRTPSITYRFIELFESHQVHRNQIPDFFNHGITLEDVNNEDLLLKKLNNDILLEASNQFGIKNSWLKCVSNQVYDVHHFYKDLDGFKIFIDNLSGEENHLISNLYLSTNKKWEYDALLVISETIGYIEDEPIDRYHLIGGWIHKYGYGRADLLSCLAYILRKKSIFLKGCWVKDSLDKACNGLSLPNSFNDLILDKRQYKGNLHWHPDSWFFNPHEFTRGLSSEFEKESALLEWLNLYKNGKLDVGYSKPLDEGTFKHYLNNL